MDMWWLFWTMPLILPFGSENTKVRTDFQMLFIATSLSDSNRIWSYSESATRKMMEVTFSKQWIHFRRSDLWPPTSTILNNQILHACHLCFGEPLERFDQLDINLFILLDETPLRFFDNFSVKKVSFKRRIVALSLWHPLSSLGILDTDTRLYTICAYKKSINTLLNDIGTLNTASTIKSLNRTDILNLITFVRANMWKEGTQQYVCVGVTRCYSISQSYPGFLDSKLLGEWVFFR